MKKVAWIMVALFVISLAIPALAAGTKQAAKTWPDGTSKGVNMFNDLNHWVKSIEMPKGVRKSAILAPKQPTTDTMKTQAPAQNWTTR